MINLILYVFENHNFGDAWICWFKLNQNQSLAIKKNTLDTTEENPQHSLVSGIAIPTLGLMDNVKELQDLQKIKITIMTKLSLVFDVNMRKNIETIIVMVKEHAHNLVGVKSSRYDII